MRFLGVVATVEFTPLLVAFCCYYCAYAAADLAGSMRLSYPAGLRLVEIPCSGKVDSLLILRAFEEGADGVCVVGCLEGDCHFRNGNLRAQKRVAAAKELLAAIGLEPERLEMFNLSGSMGPGFAELATEMIRRLRTLGPSPLNQSGGRPRRPGVGPGENGAGHIPVRSEVADL